MKLIKCMFTRHASAPTTLFGLFSSQNFKMSLVVVLFLGLTSCNPIALVNPDSYGDKWENTYLWFKPGEMNTIYISESGDPTTAKPIPNDSDFLIEWNEKGEVYNLKVTAYYNDIDFAWFTGYDADNTSEEIPWIHNGNTIELESGKLLDPTEGDGMYQISISDDLKD